jgi:heme exporter protein A
MASGFAGIGLVCRRGERIVFAGLDFAVAPGGALILTGANGSGKSSLLRLMAGLIRPFAGRLAWEGLSLTDDPAEHRSLIAYLGHQDALKPVLTAQENVEFWAKIHGSGDRTDAALEVMGLTELAGAPARFLSAGQKRRVALARFIAFGRPLWLLDEPTVGLDARSIVLLEAAIAAHRSEGGVVAVATHAPIALPDPQIIHLAEFAPDERLTDEALDEGSVA